MKILNLGSLPRTGVYHEFLRVPAMSLGLYRHAADERVPQQPHTEDEVYYVISGRGVIEVDGRDYPVSPGSVVYVPAGVPHHFHRVTEDLDVLVFFAPAEGTAAATR